MQRILLLEERVSHLEEESENAKKEKSKNQTLYSEWRQFNCY